MEKTFTFYICDDCRQEAINVLHKDGHTVKLCSCKPVNDRKRLRSIFNGMYQRCHNPKNSGYRYYGARGIEVCHEWMHDFELFYEWAIANGYKHELSIDRIDNDKGYCPTNCQWLTLSENSKKRWKKKN